MAEVNNTQGTDAAAKAAAEAAAKRAAEQAAQQAAQKAAAEMAGKMKATMPKIPEKSAEALKGINGASSFQSAKPLAKPPEAPKPPEPAKAPEAAKPTEAPKPENTLDRPDFNKLPPNQQRAIVESKYPTNASVEALEKRAADPKQANPLTREERQHVDFLRNGNYGSNASVNGGDIKVAAYDKVSKNAVDKTVGGVGVKAGEEVKVEKGISLRNGPYTSVAETGKIEAGARVKAAEVTVSHKQENKVTVDSRGVTTSSKTSEEVKVKDGVRQATLGIDDKGTVSAKVGLEGSKQSLKLPNGQTVDHTAGVEVQVEAPRIANDNRRETAARIMRTLNARGVGSATP